MNLLISSIIVGILLLFALYRFERVRPRPRDLMPVVVLTVLAILGRFVSVPIPNFQPATALIILVGLYFGRNSGLISGMLVALVSNMVLGQGPWTLWQMMAWGLIGYGAGVVGTFWRERNFSTDSATNSEKTRKAFFSTALICVFGALASLLFGMFLDVQFFIAYLWETGWSGLSLALIGGFQLNLIHAASTVAFLALTLFPWGKKLARLKTKYNIHSI